MMGSIKQTGNLKGSMSAPKIIEDTETVFILEDEAGTEVVGVLVDEVTAFDATENDIRTGKIAVTDNGVTVGTKEIPAYHTTEGYRLIPAGEKVIVRIESEGLDLYDFTKLQALFCPFAGSIADSVAAEKVAINDAVYNVQSTEKIATVTKDAENKEIVFEVTADALCLIRYITYKEVI